MADINIRISGKAGRITLNRPEALNALSFDILRQIDAAFDEVAGWRDVRAILAQRLVRKLCPVCKGPAELTDKEMRALSLDASRMEDATIFGPVGCEKCRGGGYKGRMGMFELFEIDDEVRQMINTGLTTTQLRRRARELGMRTLREDGIRKVLAGLTAGSEVVHATMSDSD